MADWSHLPKDLLLLILEKLNCEIYLNRFRSVCSTWRFSIPKPHYHFPLKLRHFSDPRKLNKLYKHSIFLLKSLTTPSQQTLRPWLIGISPTSTGKFNLWHPLLRHKDLHMHSNYGVLDFNQLSFSDLAHMFCVHQLSMFDQLQDIVTQDTSRELMTMFHCGDHGWSKIPDVEKSHGNICIFKGRPCVTDKTGRTVMIESDLSVHLLAEPIFCGYLNSDINIMVENESELLLVHKYYDVYIDDNYHFDHLRLMIDVFRLDQKEKKWLKLANLGDTIVFFGQCVSFAASALDLGFDKGNFVIYCNDNDDDVKSEMSIFHLDTQRNFPLSNYPNYLKLFWPPPEWIVSRCL